MKAQYILEAIRAMEAADKIGFMMDAKRMAKILNDLAEARINLRVYSGLNDVEVPIEHETEQQK